MSSVFTDRPLNWKRPFGSFAVPMRSMICFPFSSFPTINSASNSCVPLPACITKSAPIVTKGPAGAVLPFGCFKAAGASSVTANTGLVILIVLGKPGTLRSGNATFRLRSFNLSALLAAFLNVEALIVPTIGITVSDTPPDFIKEPIPFDPLISKSARRLNPSFNV